MASRNIKLLATAGVAVVAVGLLIFSFMTGATIRDQFQSHERTATYAMIAMEELQYELILKMRDEQELKERYLWLVNMTSLDLRSLDLPRVPRLSVSIGDN